MLSSVGSKYFAVPETNYLTDTTFPCINIIMTDTLEDVGNVDRSIKHIPRSCTMYSLCLISDIVN